MKLTDRIVGFSPLFALNVPVFFSADSFSHPVMLFHIKQATINFTGCADSPNTCRVYSPSWLFQAGKSQFVCAQRNFLPTLMSPLQQPCHKNIAGSSTNPGTVVSCQTASPAKSSHIYSHVFFEATCCLWFVYKFPFFPVMAIHSLHLLVNCLTVIGTKMVVLSGEFDNVKMILWV